VACGLRLATLPLPLPGESGFVGLFERRFGLAPVLDLPLLGGWWWLAVDLHLSQLSLRESIIAQRGKGGRERRER
jgi:hypothetical protein